MAGAEGARRATGDPATGADGSVPDPAVSEKARRRRFTTEYKLHILREVDQRKAPGEVGAILRREGLHSSNLTTWRRQIDQVAREGLAKKKRGPKAKPEDPRVKQLERENARLKRRLQRAEAMLEIQKKASEHPPEPARRRRQRLKYGSPSDPLPGTILCSSVATCCIERIYRNLLAPQRRSAVKKISALQVKTAASQTWGPGWSVEKMSLVVYDG